ncbi:MAG: SDR family NAD(P)-dependent oxidoreductase, partial [Chloroflexi bacterium]|nr:SDR family NAD(P)-dependent oxidoreductase [Chloroflexota bacterium]
MALPLSGRVALVTGASRGIGRAVAIRLAKDGATVALNATRDVSATAEAIRAAGRACSTHIADVRDSAAVEKMVADIVTAHGSLDILVSNAGINRDGLMLRMSDNDWKDVLETNITGAFLCARAALKQMVRKRWGRIVCIGSVVGLRGNAGQANYSASKSALVGFARSIAAEVASRNITANVIAPGFIETEMTSKLTEAQKSAIRDHVPL